MRADELKQKLTEELSDMAPNRLDDLLRACEESAVSYTHLTLPTKA